MYLLVIIQSSGNVILILNLQVRPGTQPGQKVVLKRKGENSDLILAIIDIFSLSKSFFTYLCSFSR